MNQKPRLRFDYRKDRWRLNGLPFELCHICGRPNHRKGTCGRCQNSRYEEMRAQRRVFNNAIRRGALPDLSSVKINCVDCEKYSQKNPEGWKNKDLTASEWDHRDWREPLKVEPVCRMHNARRGRAMTAYEASFVKIADPLSTAPHGIYTPVSIPQSVADERHAASDTADGRT